MPHEKYSGGTMILMHDYEARGEAALEVRSRAFGVGQRVRDKGEPTAVVFLHCHARQKLGGFHESVTIQPGEGDIRTARVPLSRMKDVANDPAVRRVQIARYLRPKMDLAATKIHVPAFRARSDSDGSKVVIGIVDSGIDATHASFAGGRILRVWDQLKDGHAVPEGPGIELTGAAIAAHSTDELGHGTHVAGIAGGALAPFVGVAPKAKFVIVKTTFLDADIADGVRYLFRVFNELGMPGVVNLSLGGHLDAHDGTDELSAVIDAHSGPAIPGRVVCCAAGNEGTEAIHAQTTVTMGPPTGIQVAVPDGTPLVVLNGWYAGQDEIEVAIQDPTGFATPFQPPIPMGQQMQEYQVDSGLALITTPGPNPDNHDHHIHIQLVGVGAPGLTGGTWTILLRGRTLHSGRIDFWSADLRGGSGVPFSSHINDGMKIGMPGCAAQAITVGNFATRSSFVDRQGFTRSVPFTEDTMATDSSPGPLRNGGKKPDLAAPGKFMISALAAHSGLQNEALLVDGPFKVDAGSSMSTAFLSGLAALMLHGNPALTAVDVKQRLIAASSMPGGVAGAFDFQSGFGCVDADRL